MDLKHARIAAYARYSTDMQSDSSIQDQLRLIERFVDREGGRWDEVTCFEDAATSAASLNRVGFMRLKARLIKPRPDFDLLIVESVDRLSRNMADSARLLQELEFAGVRLIGVSDGIDTASANARMSFGFRAVMNDQYLVDLGHKTTRGLRARAEKGFATGGVAYGYRTIKNLDPKGKSQGSTIGVQPEEAEVVRRIFKLWVDGHACIAIAGILNADGVPSPRKNKKLDDRGWPDTTVRAILRNAAYVGEWTYGAHRWTKDPVSGKRRRKGARPGEVQRLSRPELRIVDEETWASAQTRIVEVTAQQNQTKARAPVRKTSYPLSGLLHCSQCGAPMVIAGGSNRRVYRCGTYHKRRNCTVHQPLHEEQISTAVVDLLQQRLQSPQAIGFLADQLRRKAADSQGAADRQRTLTESALREVQARIDRLIENLATGTLSELVLRPLNQAIEKEEATRMALEAKLAVLDAQRQASQGVPSKKELVLRAKGIIENLNSLLRIDAVKAREQIRAFLVDGRISMEPKDDGSWAAQFKYFPTLLLRPQNGISLGPRPKAVYSSSCADRI